MDVRDGRGEGGSGEGEEEEGFESAKRKGSTLWVGELNLKPPPSLHYVYFPSRCESPLSFYVCARRLR